MEHNRLARRVVAIASMLVGVSIAWDSKSQGVPADVCNAVAFMKAKIPPRPEGAVDDDPPEASAFDDLDGDGKKETVVTFRAGLQDNEAAILKRVLDGTCFQIVYRGAVPKKALATTTNGWKDIEARQDIPPSGHAEVTLKFVDGEYKIRKVGKCIAEARGTPCSGERKAGLIDKTEDEKKADAERAAKEKVAKARSSLQGLFSACAANKAKIVTWKRQGTLAARRGDGDGAQAAFQKIRDLEPTWDETLTKLRDAISVVTDDEGPEFRKMMLRVRRECST